MVKIDRTYVRSFRYAVQWAIFLLIAWGGFRFYEFTEHFLSGGPQVDRPPMVEGFLPIGSLMALKLWITRGVFDWIHPAGLVIFAAAILISLWLKKSFCGWICPVGTLSEAVHKLGARAFGRNYQLGPRADIALRSLKYILMGIFLYIVFIKMTPDSVLAFMGTPYWKVADAKMLFFFTKMSMTTAVVLLALVAVSLPVKNFWCRYLCPYGALVGLISMLSPVKIRRDEAACINCQKCAKTCPANLPVDKFKVVRSPECTGCLSCVSVCPAKGALDVGLPGRKINPVAFGLIVIAVFFGIILAAKLSGHWQGNVTYQEFKELLPHVSEFIHPQS